MSGSDVLEFPFLGTLVRIEERKRQAVWDASYGLVIWNAAFALCALFEQGGVDFDSSTTVLELGAGCGLVGIALAKAYGARVLLTDYEPRVIESLERNVLLNDLDPSSVRIQSLDWANTTLPAAEIDTESKGHYNHIIAADLLYNDTELLYPDLARTYATTQKNAHGFQLITATAPTLTYHCQLITTTFNICRCQVHWHCLQEKQQ